MPKHIFLFFRKNAVLSSYTTPIKSLLEDLFSLTTNKGLVSAKKKIYSLLIGILFFLICSPLGAHNISEDAALEMAQKIWYNECRGTIKGLTSWNDGEDFASMGIGHFIWYPEGRMGVFEETFPHLLTFLESRGKILPPPLQKNRKCPWYTKKDFEKDFDESSLRKIRRFLYETRSDQALFMVKRLEESLPKLLACAPKEKEHIETLFQSLLANTKGTFILLDYINFKGYGTSPNERYQEQGWGLLQVLLAMPPKTEKPCEDFVAAAKKVLTRRVKNSLPERREDRWLEGWHKRLERYLD